MTEIVTKKVLANKLAEEKDLTKKDALDIVNYLFEEVASSLEEGNTVDINGFGKFVVKERAARTGINPLTKEKVEIPACNAVGFKPSKTLKDLVK